MTTNTTGSLKNGRRPCRDKHRGQKLRGYSLSGQPLQCLEVFDYFLAVDLGPHLTIDLGDLPLWIDDEAVTFGKADKRQGPERAVLSGHLAIGVRQQRKRQAMFAGKPGMALRIVDADSKNFRIQFPERR